MVALLLACAAAPDVEEERQSDTADTGPDVDTADTADEPPPTAVVTFTNGSDLPLSGSYHTLDYWMMGGIPLEPGATRDWEIETPETVNFIYEDFDSERCWGVAGLSLHDGDVLAYDIPEPTGARRTDNDGLDVCKLPD